MKLYKLVRGMVRIAYGIYFKKISYAGEEKIPTGKPMLFCVNHPTAFFEPSLLASTLVNNEFYFLTRGDLFKKPFFRKLLNSLNMVPIFRFRDGFGDLRQNMDTMSFVYAALAESKTLMIFIEGSTETVKRLRPIQKGFARMAFGSYDLSGDIDLHIVPVCLTFTDPHTPRGEAMFEIGNPLPLRNYYALYHQSSGRAVSQLMQDLYKEMRPLITHVAEKEDETVSEQLFTIYQNSFPEPVFPIYHRSKRRLMAHQEIADNLNEMEAAPKADLKAAAAAYFDQLAQLQLTDRAVAQPWNGRFKHLLALILGFIPFVLGYLGHAIPIGIGRNMKDNKVKHLEFKGPVFAAVSMMATVVQYLILFLLALIVNNWGFWLALLLMPFLGFYALLYHNFWKNYTVCKRFHAVSGDIQETLMQTRRQLLKLVFQREKP